jgi:type III secretion protein C
MYTGFNSELNMNISMKHMYYLKKISLSFCPLFVFLMSPMYSQGYSDSQGQSNSSSSQERSSYESLTEEKGKFLQRKLKREQSTKEKQAIDNEKDLTAQASKKPPTPELVTTEKPQASPIINFNNVSITEVLKYISRLTSKNFIYDPNELQFNITMISEASTTLEDLIAMVLQSLQIHGYIVNEQDNGFIIHANPTIKSPAHVQPNKRTLQGPKITTQVFCLQNTAADKCAAIIQTMSSVNAIVATVSESKVIVSDIDENVQKIAEVIQRIDLETQALEIGQYVVINSSPTALASLVQRMIAPIAASKPYILIPHSGSNSIYIISTPYLIEKSLGIMQTVDLSRQQSGLLSDDKTRFDKDLQDEELRRSLFERSKGGEPAMDELTREDLEYMSIEEVRQELIKRGYTVEEVEALSPEMARALLWQLLLAEREARKRALTQRYEYNEGNLPLGTTDATQFHIHKLQYRKSSEVATALRAIAASMMGGATSSASGANPNVQDVFQSDLVLTLNSVQALDDNNTIVFTGTRTSIQKIKELIAQIDLPVRQVFIEALVLDTTLSNSLNFGVEWGGKLVRNNFGAQVGFTNPNASPFGTQFNAVTITDANVLQPVHITPPATGGLSAGAIGRKIKFHGKGFRSIGALINAMQANNEVHIIMNPKITAEHNIPAEIFVGSQVPIKGQSIANATTGSTSSIVATNYETRNVGISLKVTPLISSHETVTLIIEQKISSASSTQVSAQGGTSAPPATVNETRTTTRIHLPSDHFLVMSGMIQEGLGIKSDKIPCLGGLPIIGNLFGNTTDAFDKRNIMIFIRPIIIDTENDIDEITKHQEQVFKDKSRVQQGWDQQLDTGKALLNILDGS